MLSGESTPLLKESIEFLEGTEKLDVDSSHKNAMLFSGTKVLQARSSESTPDGGCLGIVQRTGFGTSQGQLVRTMIFSTERVSANNLESFLFIGFLLIFAVAASWYVWTKGARSVLFGLGTCLYLRAGLERDLKKSKLLLDCILIVTSVVPPELPMELSLAVNASLVALSKFGGFPPSHQLIPSLILPIQRSSARNLSVFRLQEESMFAVSIRQARSRRQTLFWRGWLALGTLALRTCCIPVANCVADPMAKPWST